MHIQNITKDIVLIKDGHLANTHWARLKGLIGVKEMSFGDGILITPCNSIHCMFMSIPIDVLYADADDRVVDIDPTVKPWSICRPRRSATYVIELPCGMIAQSDTAIGDQLEVRF